MLINTNYFIRFMKRKKKDMQTCFIKQAITNKITGLVKGNYVDLT